MLAVFTDHMYLWIAVAVIVVLALMYFMRDTSGHHRR